ncbi:hypothetical protein, partial [Dubosiella newyorkensis]|uniref:hypothetical protein n=1 Tax=Dubosiella newyorkensis TaxID=1862672 RepID=UPI00267594B8
LYFNFHQAATRCFNSRLPPNRDVYTFFIFLTSNNGIRFSSLTAFIIKSSKNASHRFGLQKSQESYKRERKRP